MRDNGLNCADMFQLWIGKNQQVNVVVAFKPLAKDGEISPQQAFTSEISHALVDPVCNFSLYLNSLCSYCICRAGCLCPYFFVCVGKFACVY